jgi:hypothetical protein
MLDETVKNIFSYKLNYIIIPLIIFLIIFSFIRSYQASFVHDESFTYLFFVQKSLSSILSFEHPSANNHLLNTIFAKFFNNVFGSSELSLRFPNFLAHIGYIVFSLLLIKNVNKKIMLPAFVILNFNHKYSPSACCGDSNTSQ